MKSFGVWLWQNQAQAKSLCDAAVELGRDWPIASTRRSDYENSLAKDPNPDPQNKEVLEQLWPAYEAEEIPTKRTFPDVLWSALSNVGAWGVAIGGLGLLLFFLFGLQDTFIDKMATIGSARGLLTFLFGISTVGIAVIIVIANFLSSERGEELGQRVQHGKDVLTILIGVFGAILGFYFGALEDGGTPPPPPTENGQPAPPTEGQGAASPEPR